MAFIIGFPIVLILIVFVMGIAQTLQDKGSKDAGVNVGYITDDDWIKSGGKIIYHHWGKERTR